MLVTGKTPQSIEERMRHVPAKAQRSRYTHLEVLQRMENCGGCANHFPQRGVRPCAMKPKLTLRGAFWSMYDPYGDCCHGWEPLETE